MIRSNKGAAKVLLEPLPQQLQNNSNTSRNNGLIKSNSLIQEIDLVEIMDQASKTANIYSTHYSTLRQTQQLSFIKSKFMRMIELQNQNIVERNQFEKQRQAILREEQRKVKYKVNRIKDERSHSGITSRNWKVKNMQEGAIIRSKKLENEFILAKREIEDMKSKKSIVNDLHKTTVMIQGKDGDGSLRKRLKFYEEYRCGSMRDRSQLKLIPKSLQKQIILEEKWRQESYLHGK